MCWSKQDETKIVHSNLNGCITKSLYSPRECRKYTLMTFFFTFRDDEHCHHEGGAYELFNVTFGFASTYVNQCYESLNERLFWLFGELKTGCQGL